MLPFQKVKGSFVTLEQSILPGFVPPKPLDRVLKGSFTLCRICTIIACSAAVFTTSGACNIICSPCFAGISAKQVQIILQDLRQEVERQSSADANGVHTASHMRAPVSAFLSVPRKAAYNRITCVALKLFPISMFSPAGTVILFRIRVMFVDMHERSCVCWCEPALQYGPDFWDLIVEGLQRSLPNAAVVACMPDMLMLTHACDLQLQVTSLHALNIFVAHAGKIPAVKADSVSQEDADYQRPVGLVFFLECVNKLTCTWSI